MTVSDSKFKALRDQGFEGSVPDMILQWLQFNGADSAHVSDAWTELLRVLDYTSFGGTVSDRWFKYLKSVGYTGSISDMSYDFWLSGGGIPEQLFNDGSDGLVLQSGNSATRFQEIDGVGFSGIDDPVGLHLDSHLPRSILRWRSDGTSGNKIRTPDSPQNSVLGDIDVTVYFNSKVIGLATQALVTKYNFSSSQRAWRVHIDSSGFMTITISEDGSGTQKSYVCPNILPLDYVAIRIYLDVDVGDLGTSSLAEFEYYNGVGWTSLGSDSNTATSIHDSSESVIIGTTGNNVNSLVGDVSEVQVRDGINGTLVVDFNPERDYIPGESTMTSSTTGETYDMIGTSHIVPDGHHATQAVSSSRPTTVYRSNMELLKYDGVDDFHTLGAPNIGGTSLYCDPSQEFTVEGTIEFIGNGTVVGKAGGVLSSRTFQVARDSGNLNTVLRGQSTPVAPGVADKIAFILWWDKSNAFMLVNSLTPVSVTVGIAAEETSEDIIIGARTGGTGFFLDGYIGDIVIKDKALTLEEAKSEMIRLSNKFGVDLSDPSSGFSNGFSSGFR